MPYKSFVIPVCHGDWAERELNEFLRTHRVLAVERRWVDRGENSFWAVWVDYLDTPSPTPQRDTGPDAKKRVACYNNWR
jgi:hypothetical protein